MSTTVSGVTILIPDGVLSNNSISEQAAIATTKLAQNPLQKFPVPLVLGRVWDAIATLLPSAGANDDLGLVAGTFATDSVLLSAGDVKSLGAVTRYARFPVVVPANYQDGETIQIRVRAAVETTVADTSCTVDCSTYKGDGSGAVGSDLVTTAAASINSLTPADVDFTIDASGVDPGDLLDLRVAIAANDAATGTSVTPVIYSVTLLCDTRG